jgi:hypothetical protein
MCWQAEKRLEFPPHHLNLASLKFSNACIVHAIRKRKFNPHRNCALVLYSKERLFLWELLALGWGIHRRNGIPLGIFRSWTRYPPKECNSARNYQVLDKESTGGMEFHQELLAPGQGIHWKKGIPPGITNSWTWFETTKIKNLPVVTIPGTLTLKHLYRIRLHFKIKNKKTSFKWKIILIRPYCELNIYVMKP